MSSLFQNPGTLQNPIVVSWSSPKVLICYVVEITVVMMCWLLFPVHGLMDFFNAAVPLVFGLSFSIGCVLFFEIVFWDYGWAFLQWMGLP